MLQSKNKSETMLPFKYPFHPVGEQSCTFFQTPRTADRVI